MSRNYLKGTIGDQINAVLCAVGSIFENCLQFSFWADLFIVFWKLNDSISSLKTFDNGVELQNWRAKTDFFSDD